MQPEGGRFLAEWRPGARAREATVFGIMEYRAQAGRYAHKLLHHGISETVQARHCEVGESMADSDNQGITPVERWSLTLKDDVFGPVGKGDNF